MSKKRCTKCYKIKDRSEFYKNKTNKDGLMYYCSVCDTKRLSKMRGEVRTIDKRFLYGKGNIDALLKNKKYLKDKKELFALNGNGWWWLAEDRTHRRSKRGKYKKKRLAGQFVKE